MTTGLWSRFERDLAEWLRGYARQGLRFCAGRTTIPGFPAKGFHADALLTDSRRLLAVEVEIRQSHPETNVGKYWLLSGHCRYESIILFHIYTPTLDSCGRGMELGRRYAEKLAEELPFHYVVLDRRSARDPRATLEEVQSLIAQRIEREFRATSKSREEQARAPSGVQGTLRRVRSSDLRKTSIPQA